MRFISCGRIQVCGLSFDLDLKTSFDSKQTKGSLARATRESTELGTGAYISNG